MGTMLKRMYGRSTPSEKSSASTPGQSLMEEIISRPTINKSTILQNNKNQTVMKQIMKNEVLHAVLIIAFSIFLLQGLFRIGALIFSGSFYISPNTQDAAVVFGVIIGILMCIYHFVQSE